VGTPTAYARAMEGRSFARIVAVAAGIGFGASGLWALVAPESFFDALAPFDPYNQHFVQDIGSFLIGLGSVLLLASVPARADALAVALLGVGIGSLAHTVSHVIGIDLGGRPAIDIPLLGALTVVLLVAGWIRKRAAAER
jgi:hypothetical protein